MPVSDVDRDTKHLYPDFLTRLNTVIKEIEAKTNAPWVIVEGFRSQARQDWLYAQGRTRPGNKVTWIRSPRWHGCGLAADLAPTHNGSVWYQCPKAWWDILRQVGKLHGLINPAWTKGDLGHLQHGDASIRPKAEAWVKRGFKL